MRAIRNLSCYSHYCSFTAVVFALVLAMGTMQAATKATTCVSIVNGQWHINGEVTYPGTKAEGLLMNVRMVNAVFEDANKKTCPPGFDPQANTTAFISQIPDYVAHGVRAFTLNLQGGFPGYEGALNSAFRADGSLREEYMQRVRRVIEACDRQGIVVILGCFYQRQDQALKNDDAVRAGVMHAAKWLQSHAFKNVVLEIANEFGHSGFDHSLLRTPDGITELIHLARRTAPGLLVSCSSEDGTVNAKLAQASDFLLIHFNVVKLKDIPQSIARLKKYGKPIVCNEDDKIGRVGAKAAALCVSNGASWGLMEEKVNQRYPFTFQGAADDSVVYAKLKQLTSRSLLASSDGKTYFPPPESQGGWRQLKTADEIRRIGGMDPEKLDDLKQWLLHSDNRPFAADVIRHGYIVMEITRDDNAMTATGRVASVSKAICATVCAIASERSQHGLTPKKMKFSDRAFKFIPWAYPLSDTRKAKITITELLNNTSGICPEATGAVNEGTWEYILGHSGDPRTAKLAFDPGTACGYSTMAFDHVSLIIEDVTGMPYNQFATKFLFEPLGIQHVWFGYFNGGAKIGRHPSHYVGMSSRNLARIAYCMLHEGQWNGHQVIPKWFVDLTGKPTSDVKTPEMRWKLNPQIFSDGWQLPALGWGGSGKGIPADARDKPGSGGQLMAFVPSLDLVVTRQTGAEGDWQFNEYLRRACAAVLAGSK